MFSLFPLDELKAFLLDLIDDRRTIDVLYRLRIAIFGKSNCQMMLRFRWRFAHLHRFNRT